MKRTGLLWKAGDAAEARDRPLGGYLGGIMNTLAPEPGIPSQQGPDAQTVD
ncbi:MAG: hypothetical protein M9955_06660 [Rhizobiaceae bacterium]|nr:hypothetical protein [Rhizobiaceae bacterium]